MAILANLAHAPHFAHHASGSALFPGVFECVPARRCWFPL